MARKSQSQQRESRSSQGGSSRSGSRSTSSRSASNRDDTSQGSASSRGRGSRSNSTNRGDPRGRSAQNESWQSQQGGRGRDQDFGRDYGQQDYQGQRGYEGDYGDRSNFGGEDYRGREDYQGQQGQRYQRRDWDEDRSGGSRGRSEGSAQDWGNRGYQSEGYESRGSGRSRDRDSREFMSEDRGYDGRRELGRERGYGGGSGGGFQDDDVHPGFTRQNYEDWRPSDDQRYSARSGGGRDSWDEDRGGFGRERSGRGENQDSFRQREYAPERGRSEGYRDDDRFYVEGDVRDYHDYRHRDSNAGGRQNEDERYFSGRGQRNQGGGSQSQRSSGYRGSESRRRE